MDANLNPIFAYAAERQRVVEILGVGRVNGKGRYAAEIAASGNLLLRNVLIDFVGGILNALRKPIRQTVLGQNGVHLSVVFARISQNFNHLAYRVFLSVAPLHNLGDSLLASFGIFQLIERNKNIEWHLVVLWNEEGKML